MNAFVVRQVYIATGFYSIISINSSAEKQSQNLEMELTMIVMEELMKNHRMVKMRIKMESWMRTSKGSVIVIVVSHSQS